MNLHESLVFSGTNIKEKWSKVETYKWFSFSITVLSMWICSLESIDQNVTIDHLPWRSFPRDFVHQHHSTKNSGFDNLPTFFEGFLIQIWYFLSWTYPGRIHSKGVSNQKIFQEKKQQHQHVRICIRLLVTSRGTSRPFLCSFELLPKRMIYGIKDASQKKNSQNQ